MNSILTRCAAILIVGLLGGCATPDFYPHESRNNVHEGKGGSRFVAEGIDIWFNGEPSRRYAILGYIDDRGMSTLDERRRYVSPDILKKAREVGADALIAQVTYYATGGPSTGGSIFHGTGGTGFGVGIGFPIGGTATERSVVKYTAVKYLN